MNILQPLVFFYLKEINYEKMALCTRLLVSGHIWEVAMEENFLIFPAEMAQKKVPFCKCYREGCSSLASLEPTLQPHGALLPKEATLTSATTVTGA